MTSRAEAAVDDGPGRRRRSGPAEMRTIRRRDEPGAEILRLRQNVPSLEAVERRRGQLWSIAGLIMLTVSAAVVLLLAVPDSVEVIPDNVGLRFGFVALSLAFLVYVFDQERRLRRLSRALVRERVLSAALEARVRDLATLSRVGQVVNSVLTMEEVLQIVLESSFELTGAVTGSVMLVEEDELVVAVSAGPRAAPPGVRQPLGAGVAGWVASRREPLLVTGTLNESQIPELRRRARDAASSVCAPMLVGGELLGILALERPPEAPAFTDSELRSVALFAANAATAVSNARRYEGERSNVERLADMLERRSEFVATMVHDLKTPLTAIVGFARLLKRDADDALPADVRSRAVGSIEASAGELVRLVEDVLRGASAEVAAEVRREPIDVGAMIRELAAVTASMAETRDGTVREIRQHLPDTPVVVHTDPPALRSILVNLLENAVKYSPPGAPVDITAEQSGDEVLVHVADKGQGIPPAELPAIFERFRRRERTGSGGVGLGLYIVRSLVLAQGGRVWVDSEVGNGSVFHVALPIRRSAPSPEQVPVPVGDAP